MHNIVNEWFINKIGLISDKEAILVYNRDKFLRLNFKKGDLFLFDFDLII